MYEIPPGARTGTHRHIAEELLLVLEGSGIDDHDGSRASVGGRRPHLHPAHGRALHCNEGDRRARLVSVWSHHPANEFLGGFEHIADASGLAVAP